VADWLEYYYYSDTHLFADLFFIVFNCFIFFCKAVDCGKLPLPMNGSMLGEETAFPNKVEFACDQGFILRGSHSRTCQADGTWSGDATSCEGRLTIIL